MINYFIFYHIFIIVFYINLFYLFLLFIAILPEDYIKYSEKFVLKSFLIYTKLLILLGIRAFLFFIIISCSII